MHTPLLTLDEALARVAEAIPAPPLPVALADRDDPAMDRSSMDGVALMAADGLLPRRVLGTLFAGEDASSWSVGHGTCVRIMTGAVVPVGADAIVPVEGIREVDGVVFVETKPEPGAFIRRQGEQARVGEELLSAGLPRTAARAGLFASIGQALPALRPVRVAVASTGDEVQVDPRPWQIRDSNGPMLADLATLLGADVTRIPAIPDTPEALAEFLDRARGFQVVITSGGVSMGEKDLLPDALRAAGATVLFHKIRLKPGKPGLVALLGDTAILALPGNPVSAYLNARLFLPVVLARLQGRAVPTAFRDGALASPVANSDDRPLLHPCVLRGGSLYPLPSRGSADLVRLAHADGFAWIPEGGHRGGECRWVDVV